MKFGIMMLALALGVMGLVAGCGEGGPTVSNPKPLLPPSSNYPSPGPGNGPGGNVPTGR